MKTISMLAATFLGIGFLPLAPGTWASLAAVLLFKYLLAAWNPAPYALLLVLVFALGIWSTGAFARREGHKDPRPAVIDEVCGQWVALILVPGTWPAVLMAFILFRIFDVLKPFPIRRLESLPRGWGIMADDIAAGVYSGLLVHIYLLLR